MKAGKDKERQTNWGPRYKDILSFDIKYGHFTDNGKSLEL